MKIEWRRRSIFVDEEVDINKAEQDDEGECGNKKPALILSGADEDDQEMAGDCHPEDEVEPVGLSSF